MAEHRERQSEWPIVRGQKIADFAVPDGYFRSNRAVSGPLRMGTAPGVGPAGLIEGAGSSSDMGMDRVSKRGFDPVGTSNSRDNAQEGSNLLSRSIRGRNDGD